MNYAGRAAGATLGYIVGNVPGAVAGYYYAKSREKTSPNNMNTPPSTGKSKRKSLRTSRAKPYDSPLTRLGKAAIKKGKKRKAKLPKAYKKAFKNVSFATGVGRFKKPKVVKQNFESKCLRRGYHSTTEKFGTVADSDCVFIYHSNYDQQKISRVLVAALFRTLFRKAGIEIGNQEAELPLTGYNDSSGFKIVYTRRNPLDGTLSTWDLFTADNDNFERVVDRAFSATGMGNHFISIMQNDNSAMIGYTEPYSLTLYQPDQGAVSTAYRLAANMMLQDEMVYLQTSSAIMVQNRTQGSAAGSSELSADRVDNQPLKGMLYQFKNGDPRLANNHWRVAGSGIEDNKDTVYGTGDGTGMRTFGGTNIQSRPGQPLMTEPPNPKIWRNVEKASKIYLDPGFMKKSKISTFIKNRLPELLRKLSVAYPGQTHMFLNAYNGLRSCKSQIIALEETLRTPTANLITCLFEGELKVGAYTVTKKIKGVFRSDIRNQTVGQLPVPSPPTEAPVFPP